VEDELRGYALSAREALTLCGRGQQVAHSVFMIFGEWCNTASAGSRTELRLGG
jgi:hypothetical protein